MVDGSGQVVAASPGRDLIESFCLLTNMHHGCGCLILPRPSRRGSVDDGRVIGEVH